MIDFDKYRKMSPFYDTSNMPKTKGDISLEQAIMEFNYYQIYAPNTHNIYVNDSVTPILGTMVDVTDLETNSDSKWVFTSLDNKIYCGDIIRWDNETWLCTYNKLKNAKSCYKAKIQPCKTHVNLAVLDGITPVVKTLPVLNTVYTTDLQEGSKRIPVETDLFSVTIPYNQFTNQIKRQSRIYLFDDAFEIVGIDYTKIDFEDGSNRGNLRWMINSNKLSDDLDNYELKVCDYYKVFSKVATVPPINTVEELSYTLSKSYLKSYDSVQINVITNPISQPVLFNINGGNVGCTITSATDDGCTITSSSNIGIVSIKISLKDNPSIFIYAKIQVKGEF